MIDLRINLAAFLWLVNVYFFIPDLPNIVIIVLIFFCLGTAFNIYKRRKIGYEFAYAVGMFAFIGLIPALLFSLTSGGFLKGLVFSGPFIATSIAFLILLPRRVKNEFGINK